MFSGVIPAVVTPFHSVSGESQIDWNSYDDLLEWLLESGVDGLVVYGTTGEAPTLSFEEKIALTKRSLEIVKGRVPVIVGGGSNTTGGSIDFIKQVAPLGVDGILAVTPYYNKPSQEGMYQHFSAIAQDGGLPVVLYNVKSRTNVELTVETISRLAQLDNIVAVKHASDSVDSISTLCAELSDAISVLSGDDPSNMYLALMGGKGTISASAGVLPREVIAVVRAAMEGDVATARKEQTALLPKLHALFSETNPVPAKTALKLLGKIKSDEVRLPLVPSSKETETRLKELLL